MRTLKGKYVLITGASGGIGEVTAKLFASLGANLYLVDIDFEKLAQLKAELIQVTTSNVKVFEVNLTQQEEIKQLEEDIDKLDVLINNAGVAFGGSFCESSTEEMNKTIHVNLIGAMNLTKALLPKLKKNEKASIVNVASGAGLVATSGMVSYSTSKFGLVGFSQALRGELKKSGVGVSVVCPAFVKTDLIGNSLKDSGKEMKELDAMVQKSGVAPEKVAKAILRAIRSNRAVVKVGALTHLGSWINRLFPGLARWVNRKSYEKLIKNKVIE